MNDNLNDIIKWKLEWYHKIVNSFDESGLLKKRVSEGVENEVKEQRRGFLGRLSATLGASLL